MKRVKRFIKKMLIGIVVAFLASTILSVLVLRWVPVWFTPLMFIRCAQQASAGEETKLRHRWVPLGEMSPALPTAVMASEDAHFLEHHGFDYKAIEHAAMRNMKHPEKSKLGASTISQQTAKNVFLFPTASSGKLAWFRKGVEAYFTVLMEFMWDKQRIMEVYLNTIEMGDGIYGAQAVAQEHFGCDAKNLTRNQCAMIAITLPNPIRMNSASPTNYMYRRQSWCLRQMKWLGHFPTRDEMEKKDGDGS